jgi:hypothetical protein
VVAILQATLLVLWMVASGHHHGDVDGCTCDEIRRSNGWCWSCETGYVAGLEVRSYTFLEALDPHGHTVTPELLECEFCRTASAENGICERCGWGIVGDRIFGSKLTYYLALAKRVDGPRNPCRSVEGHAGETGWCGSCRTGWIGQFLYDDPAVYEAVAREYRLLQLAIETLDRCESCALARYYGSVCPTCKLAFRDGQPNATPGR